MNSRNISETEQRLGIFSLEKKDNWKFEKDYEDYGWITAA